jgi:hypothetical protein
MGEKRWERGGEVFGIVMDKSAGSKPSSCVSLPPHFLSQTFSHSTQYVREGAMLDYQSAAMFDARFHPTTLLWGRRREHSIRRSHP